LHKTHLAGVSRAFLRVVVESGPPHLTQLNGLVQYDFEWP